MIQTIYASDMITPMVSKLHPKHTGYQSYKWSLVIMYMYVCIHTSSLIEKSKTLLNMKPHAQFIYL